MARHLVVLVLVVILAGFNWAVVDKERVLADGQIVYLELAPVDPRSLMQGDYMALRFAIENDIQQALAQADQAPEVADGSLIVTLDERGVASFLRLQDYLPTGTAAREAVLSPGQVRLEYRIRQGRVEFATDAFFFQEGEGERLEAARFGQFRLGDDRTMILTGLYDAELGNLQAPAP